MLHLSQSKPEVIMSNSSCPTAAKMCLNTLSYLLHSEVGMPSHNQQWRLHPWNCSRPASQVLHTNAAPNCLYPALSGCFVVKCTLSLLFFFSAHHVSSSVLTAHCCDMGQNDTIGKIELKPSIVLSSDNTNCKNDIQLFLQLFDELSVYRDYH